MTKKSVLVLIRTSLRPLMKTYDHGKYIRLSQDVLKTSSEDEGERHLQGVFKRSSLRQMFAG